MSAPRPQVIRILMIGDSNVGKTSLVVRYDKDTFSTKFMTTIGVDYRDKFLEIDGQQVKLQIWDTAGQERFRSLTANFFGKADGFVVCYDVANAVSFGHVRTWINDIHKHKRGDVDMAVCGCKCDVEEKRREVTKADAAALAAEYKEPYYEASAKNNTNVVQTFEDLARRIYRRKIESGAITKGGGGDVVLAPNEPDKKKGCC
ncbi:small GTPase superfamily [Pelagophyceae sp. CCMP2097]|nr:small GTPase superfamily [Pelagophyceae sp. CCMP2097]